MFRVAVIAAGLAFAMPTAAQSSSSGDASALIGRMARARDAGDGAAARAAADSALAMLPLADERRAEALFVRATTAPTPAAARTDWLRIVVDQEFPLRELPAALIKSQGGHARGKIIVAIPE